MGTIDDIDGCKIQLEIGNTATAYEPYSGESKHFSLEVHDQQNITSICQYLLSHEELSEYMYHADNEDMKLYSRENIFAIRDKMIETITGVVEDYHKKRSIVNSLETVEEVNDI